MSEEEIKDLALKFQSGIIESSYQINKKLEQENQQLKSVLDEIREYCNLYTRLSAKEILQILDKVKE